MKNDIDSILESMFRNGKLNFKSTGGSTGKSSSLSQGGEKPASKDEIPLENEFTQSPTTVPGAESLPSDPFAEVLQAQKSLDAVQQTGDKLSASLRQSIEQLTRAAKDDMADLELHLQQDGIDHTVSAGNSGAPQDIDAAFDTARVETISRVLGQDEFVEELVIAFKRPFVAGVSPEAPMCRGLVLGKPGTGRHSALETLTASLGRQGVLKTPKLTYVNLGSYPSPDSERLFVQDLYAALKSGASAIVFENYEKCHTSVLSMVTSLFRDGSVSLPGRYAEQKGMLVDIGTALVPGAVSSLSGAGKYLFLLTQSSKARLTDTFGAPFVAALEDICATRELTLESLEDIARRALTELCEKSRSKLGFNISFGEEQVKALAGSYRPDIGAPAIYGRTEGLYKAISEYKLKNNIKELEAEITSENGELAITGKAFAVGMVKSTASQDAVEEVKKELGEIVGLSTVKDYILSLEENFKIQQLRKEKGMKADSPSMHMIFTGNPGTGKTTVARVVSRYLKAIGVLAGGQLVEVTRADLVGKYVGHTAPLTQKAIQSALGGVLFVDEAYSLYRGRDDSFGLEAIDTLVKCMEDHRDDLVVILAGYSREMEEFLTANSGLKSRFPNIIEFPDYTAQELLDITKSIVKGKGYRIEESCDAPLLEYFEKMQQEGDPRTNGNGRMARNKVEEAVIACSRRNVKEPEETRNLELLIPEDFGFTDEQKDKSS